MNKLLSMLAIGVGPIINYLIPVLTLITICGFVKTIKDNNKLSLDIIEANRKKRGNPRHVKGGIQWDPDTEKLGENMDYMRRMDEIEREYSMYAQFVPIFPLLGLLGTVSGLMMQIDNLDMIKDALGVSLGTTFLGLTAAIALRSFDAAVVSKQLCKTRQQLDWFEKTIQMVTLDNQLAKDKPQEND